MPSKVNRIARLNAKVAERITASVGTMWTAYLFALIGIMGVVGAFTNNVVLVLVIGAISGYFLQLFLLPVIMVGQNQASEKSEARDIEQAREVRALFDALEAANAARHEHTHDALGKLADK